MNSQLHLLVCSAAAVPLALSTVVFAGCAPLSHESAANAALQRVEQDASGNPEAPIILRVVDDRDGSPISGALISRGVYNIFPDSIIGKTDDDGRLRLPPSARARNEDGDKLDDDGEVGTEALWVAADGYCPLQLQRSGFPGGERRYATARLQQGRTISGQIVTPKGLPVANEPLLLVVRQKRLTTQFQTITDVAGKFEWTGSPDGDVYIATGLGTPRAALEKLQMSHGVVVQLPEGGQVADGSKDRSLLYVEFADSGPILPQGLHSARAHFIEVTRLSDDGDRVITDPICELVISVSKDLRSIFFLQTLSSGRQEVGELRI